MKTKFSIFLGITNFKTLRLWKSIDYHFSLPPLRQKFSVTKFHTKQFFQVLKLNEIEKYAWQMKLRGSVSNFLKKRNGSWWVNPTNVMYPE